MPTARRACDYCRAHKLKCQDFDELASCGQCRKRNRPCTMPPVHSQVNPVPLNPMPSGHRRARSSSASVHNDDRILRLQHSIDELKDMLSATTDPSQAPRFQTEKSTLPACPPPAKKRRFDRPTSLQGSLDLTFSSSFPLFEASTSEEMSLQTLPSSSFQIGPALPSLSSSVIDSEASQPSMPLRNCVSKRCYLPPPDQGSSLLNEYLNDFNGRLPLFHPETLYEYVRDCYSGAADRTPLSWVLTYIALGIGHRLRAMSLFAVEDDTSNADWYLKKCLAVLPDLLLQQPTLILVQALLGVSILLQTSARSRKAALFVSTAMRMAQDLGYNEADSDGDESEQQAYVFWIACSMDTAMSLCSARPGTQKLVDISMPIPNHNPSDSLALSSSDDNSLIVKINFFQLHASLSLIQAEALEELFSVKARNQPAPITANAFQAVMSKLDAWRANPLAGTNAQDMLNVMFRSDIVHSIILEASYFGTLYQLHAANALGGFSRRLDVFAPDSLGAAVNLIGLELYDDARRLLDFAALIEQPNVGVGWVTMTARIAALGIVLACHLPDVVGSGILQAPTQAASLRLYRSTLDSLEIAAVQVKENGIAAKVDVCRQLYAQVQGKGPVL